MKQEDAKILKHTDISGGYKLLELDTPAIASEVKPGQFIHLRIPHMNEAVLRRPFSVFKADKKTLQVLYKDVGRGTRIMKSLIPGETLSIIGPLGNGYPVPSAGSFPLLVAGGYGMAALYLLALTSNVPGIAFFGGRSAQDILCVDDFKILGWDVRITTEDGSMGQRGLITQLLDQWLANEQDGRTPEFFACGPNGMLKAVGERAMQGGYQAWLSMDRKMGCGVGACLTCVQKIRTEDGKWTWLRVCKEGPVFESRTIIWDDPQND